MKKYRLSSFYLISILLFNLLFIVVLTRYYDLIILEPFFKPLTRKYLDLLSEIKVSLPYEDFIFNLSYISKLLFPLIFLLEFFYLISDKQYSHLVPKKNVIISVIIGAALYFIIRILIRYNAEHCRLFMSLISTEILSIIVLNLVLNINKKLISKEVN